MTQHSIVLKLVGFVAFVSPALVLDAGVVHFSKSFIASEIGTRIGEMVPSVPNLRGSSMHRLLQETVNDGTLDSIMGGNAQREGNATQGPGQYSGIVRILTQAIWAVIYYFLIVSKYPKLTGTPNEAAKELQAVDPVSATCSGKTSLVNCLLAWCCTAGRAAHTMDKTDTLDYWPAACAMILCPICTVFYANSFTDMNEKLGGRRQGCFMGLLCACFCQCCVVAQDAESLDLATGATTGCCGVTGGMESARSEA